MHALQVLGIVPREPTVPFEDRPLGNLSNEQVRRLLQANLVGFRIPHGS